MQEIKLPKDYGKNQTHEKWAGKFLTEEAYDKKWLIPFIAWNDINGIGLLK